MFRPTLLFTSLAAFLLGACAPQDRQAATSTAIASQVILPSYSRWVAADRQLAISALAYCQGGASLETARADFLQAQQAWAHLQPMLIGPLAEGNRTWQVQFWPDKKNLVGRQVDQLVNAQPPIDAANLAKASVVVQGLSAYEYILFDARLDLADPRQKARYCPLLEAIGEHQKSLAETVLDQWNKDQGMLWQMSHFPNPRYADAHEAIADLLRAQVTALDTLKKKLGTPMGRMNKGIAQPMQADAWRSQASLQNVRASLSAAQAVWAGADDRGLRSLLSRDQQPLAERIDSAFAATKDWLINNQQPLAELLTNAERRQHLETLYDRLNTLHRLQEGELAKALAIPLGFNANDGD